MPRYTFTPIYWRDRETVHSALLVIDTWGLTHDCAFKLTPWTNRTPFADWCYRENITADQIEIAPPRLITADAASRIPFA